MSLSGSIEDLPLLEILQVVSFCQKTGHLVVRAPEGDAGVVFRDGRVVAGYAWDLPPFAAPEASDRDAALRARLASLLGRLVRLREGEFAFNLAEDVPTRLEGRDLSGETLDYGINPEELMLDLARQLDEERRDCAAVLEASFVAPVETGGDPRPTPSPGGPRARHQEIAPADLPLRTWPSRSCPPRRRRPPSSSSTTSRRCGAWWAAASSARASASSPRRAPTRPAARWPGSPPRAGRSSSPWTSACPPSRAARSAAGSTSCATRRACVRRPPFC